MYFLESEHVLGFVLAVAAIYLLAVALGRVLKRRARVQLGVSYQILSLVLALYLPMLWLKWNVVYPPFDLQRELASAAILLGVLFGIALLKRYLWECYFTERRGIDIPKFLQQILAGILFCVALLLVAAWTYDTRLTGVQLTSTVAIGIIGWAMQDLLGNVISGVSLQIGKPFKAGDWLIIEPHQAEVIEVNWRSTRLRTNDDHYLDVPNSQIAKSTIINLSYPSHLHAMRVRVGVVYDAPPNRVKSVLMHAALETPEVKTTPAPKIFLIDFADSAVTYEVKYWLENHAHYNEITDALRTNIWYGLKRAGISIPFPIRTVQVERKKAHAAASSSAVPAETHAIIRRKPFFECLTDEQATRILSSAEMHLFGHREKIVQQGAEGDSMFVLVSGTAEVYVRHGDGQEPARVATLQAGDYFGEMSLLTGESRSATVVAAGDCEVLKISKAHLAPMLQENAGLRRTLSEMLARRRMENEDTRTAASQKTVVEQEKEYAARFLARLASFFEL